MSDGGKGSKARPFGVEFDKYSSNWDSIFGKKPPKEVEDAVIEDEAFNQIERTKNVISDQKPD